MRPTTFSIGYCASFLGLFLASPLEMCVGYSAAVSADSPGSLLAAIAVPARSDNALLGRIGSVVAANEASEYQLGEILTSPSDKLLYRAA